MVTLPNQKFANKLVYLGTYRYVPRILCTFGHAHPIDVRNNLRAPKTIGRITPMMGRPCLFRTYSFATSSNGQDTPNPTDRQRMRASFHLMHMHLCLASHLSRGASERNHASPSCNQPSKTPPGYSKKKRCLGSIIKGQSGNRRGSSMRSPQMHGPWQCPETGDPRGCAGNLGYGRTSTPENAFRIKQPRWGRQPGKIP